LEPDQVQLDATLTSPLGNGPISAHCNHRRDPTGTGACLLKTPKPLILNPAQNPLNLLAAPPEVQILQGKLTFSLEGQWQTQKPLQLRADLDATLQQGSVLDIPFSGLQVQQQVQVLPQLQSIKNGRLQLASMGGPVPMQDLTLATRIRPDRRSRQPIVTLEQGTMRLLDGVLRLPQQCTYALDGTPTTCMVQLDGINLESLVALHQVEGLTVSGRVRGRLPLHFSAPGLRIEHGILENEAKGGIIRYRPPTGAMENSPLTAYALTALRDLHYQHLAAQVDYQPDGTLAVALQVRGNNPGLDNGRPVHLNLNTEQNLLSLLKSLQYSQSLSSELGRKLIKSRSP
ncbi:MAG: YdbH domain-containing protein, partial [Desulfobulbus sp.]